MARNAAEDNNGGDLSSGGGVGDVFRYKECGRGHKDWGGSGIPLPSLLRPSVYRIVSVEELREVQTVQVDLVRMLSSILTSALLASAAVAYPLESLFSKRAVIPHDQVQGFSQTVPNNVDGQLYLKHKPWLEVYNGCVPFPGVNANGDTSGGLDISGSPKGGCERNLGQVYARGASYGGRYAIMYSWYMPKDSPSSGLGHRHEWENAVVWLSSQSTSASIVGLSVSAHGNYDKSTDVGANYAGTRAKVGYISIWPVNHQMVFTDEQGGEQPLIAWESLTPAARTALENTNFESATVPFKESTFLGNLEKAKL